MYATMEKKPPKVGIALRFSNTHHRLSNCADDISVADFQDPFDQLPTPGTDRIRAILGLRKGASLPKVNAERMLRYYRYLLPHLTLPCEARFSSDAAGVVYPVAVTGLVDPETTPSDKRTGLCCIVSYRNDVGFLPLVDIEVDADSPNFQLLEDYWFWLWNWRESHCPARSPHRVLSR